MRKDQVLSTLIELPSARGYWCKDKNIISALKQCESLSEFRKRFPSGMIAIYRRRKKNLVRKVFKKSS